MAPNQFIGSFKDKLLHKSLKLINYDRQSFRPRSSFNQ